MHSKKIAGHYTNKELRSRYEHRDLSWLAFNREVLHLASNRQIPLAERVRFLAIAANNLPDWFSVRLAGFTLLGQVKDYNADKFGWKPKKLLRTFHKILIEGYRTTKPIYAEMSEIYRQLIEELALRQIRILTSTELDQAQKETAAAYYKTNLADLCRPAFLNKEEPEAFPQRTVVFGTRLSHRQIALVPLPRKKRIVELPDNASYRSLMLTDNIIQERLTEIIQQPIKSFCAMRLFRDEDIQYPTIHGEEQESPIERFRNSLKRRQLERGVWLEHLETPDDDLIDTVGDIVHAPKLCRVTVGPLIDYSFLFELYGKIPDVSLKYPGFTPREIVGPENIFETIKQGDLLLQYPYNSFSPVTSFFEAAAEDPLVTEIKTTIYRAANNSRIIQALGNAARNGKTVTALIEVKARFDENNNYAWRDKLLSAGCTVLNRDDTKVHAKFALVSRKENGEERSYVYLATGNLNESTAQQYTDIGLFLSPEDNELSVDLKKYFDYVTDPTKDSFPSERIFVNGSLKAKILREIDREIETAKSGGEGTIIAKMNALEDRDIIERLYAASQQGVRIQLIVRGACSLRPAMPGLSENITVRRIVGRFLEHHRIFQFGNGDDLRNKRVFISSADWMERNLERREELMFEVRQKENKEELLHILNIFLTERNPQDYFIKPVLISS